MNDAFSFNLKIKPFELIQKKIKIVIDGKNCFDKNKFDEILGLQTVGLKSSVVCAVGFRSPEDKAAGQAKVRFGVEKVVVKK